MPSTVSYPPAFHQKVLAQEAPGGVPSDLELVIPTVTQPGEMFDVKVTLVDESGYPSVECEGQVEVVGPKQTHVLSFVAGQPAVGSVSGLSFAEEGLYRLQGRWNGLQADSNPSLCTLQKIPRIFWGDPHVHTVLSNCNYKRSRSMNFCFTAGRYVTALDWVSAADHVSGGRCDRSKWKEQGIVSNLYDDPPHFATLPGYEASLQGGAGGDNNVYLSRFPETYVDERDGGTVRTLCDKLTEHVSESEFFVVPHHTTRFKKHGEISDEIYPGPGRMPVVEIHSKWGTSEYRGNPTPLEKIHPGPSYVQDLLARGLRLGFIGGTDTHATIPSGWGEDGHLDRPPGLTAIRSDELSRKAVFNAIRNRDCYAACIERVLLHGTIAGCRFGQQKSLSSFDGPVEVDVLVAGKSDIERIDLIRNGTVIHSQQPNDWQARFTVEDADDLGDVMFESPYLGRFVYYYIRVACTSGARAWSSPVWLVSSDGE